jgi:hypothetical protein
MLARALADRLAADGVLVAGEVSPTCGGSARISTVDRLLWLLVKGLPWVFKRGADLVPYLVQALVEALLRPGGIVTVEPPPVQVERAAIDQHTS